MEWGIVNAHIARMANPWTITGTPGRLAVPTVSWETRGYAVNEGPAVVQRNGKVFMTYSASATDANYCLGLLTASSSADLLAASSWTKNPNPVFVSDAGTGQYGLGHNFPDRYLRHWDFRARLDPNVTNLADSQFRIVTGLAGGVSLESTNYPGYYLRHRNNEVFVDRNDGTAQFRSDASFTRRAGVADPAGVSFESVNLPGQYLRHYNYLITVQSVPDTTARADATFHLE